MFDVIETLLTQLIGILPFLIPFVLVINLICYMLWGSK